MRWACVLVALALAGCAPHMIYLRADGINPVSNPVVNQQFEMDRTICQATCRRRMYLELPLRAAEYLAS